MLPRPTELPVDLFNKQFPLRFVEWHEGEGEVEAENEDEASPESELINLTASDAPAIMPAWSVKSHPLVQSGFLDGEWGLIGAPG